MIGLRFGSCRNPMTISRPSKTTWLMMTTSSLVSALSIQQPVEQPWWCPLTPPPRLSLANLPTPLQPMPRTSILRDDLSWFVKRDDATAGVELGGNKLRKLEFLLQEAVSGGFDAVVTIGGIQSNHCRATAAASRMLNLDPHLILRTKADCSESMVGNLLVDRLAGSSIYTCTPGEYGRVGSTTLVEKLCAHLLENEGVKAYPIPVGGSNALGTWGYLLAAAELWDQWYTTDDMDAKALDHIVVACGSGGTLAGITLGMALLHEKSGRPMPKIHAVGVCDDPQYFYDSITKIIRNMGFDVQSMSSLGFDDLEEYVRAHVTVHQGKGKGYAVSSREELEFYTQFGRTTGIIVDPVYTGKALYHFCAHVSDSGCRPGETVLFWHTGGVLGMYDKTNEFVLSTDVLEQSPYQRLDVYGNGKGDVDMS